MSLDKSLHMLYGYRFNGNGFDDILKKYTDDNDCINGKDIYELLDDFYNKDGELIVVQDLMCGEVEFVGIPIISEDIYNDVEFEFDGHDIRSWLETYSDRLDEAIQKYFPYLLNNEYDPIGLMNGQLPKLYVFTMTS